MPAYDKPPVVLSFLAPAPRCNQRCPNCILTEVVREPVRGFGIAPETYARFVEDFVREGVPILGVMFQGYEVTLASSWPYVEAVFDVAQRHKIPRSFITNGMLLPKWTRRIRDLDPARISISMDGSSPAVNDRIRGLPGAFETTCRSIRLFLRRLPDFADRLAVASCVVDRENWASLLEMPALLRDMGIARWIVSLQMCEVAGRVGPVVPLAEAGDWLEQLLGVARAGGIDCVLNDDADVLGDLRLSEVARAHIHSVYDEDFLYRLDPLGYVRVGDELRERWDTKRWRHWDPARGTAVTAAGYWDTVKARATEYARSPTSIAIPGP